MTFSRADISKIDGVSDPDLIETFKGVTDQCQLASNDRDRYLIDEDRMEPKPLRLKSLLAVSAELFCLHGGCDNK